MTPVNRLENSWKIYSDIQFQIRYADRKVQILLAIGLAVLSFTMPHMRGVLSEPTFSTITLILLALISGGFFFSFVLLALFARGTVVQTQSVTPITFFGHIVQYDSAQSYGESAGSAKPEDILEDLHLQIYQISHICMKKYLYYKKTWIALLSTIFFVIMLLSGTLV